MATGVEIVASVATLVQLSGLFFKTVKDLRRVKQRIEFARKHVRGVCKETKIFSEVLNRFSITLSEAEAAHPQLLRDFTSTNLPGEIEEASLDFIERISTLVTVLKPFDSDSGSTFRKRVVALRRWSTEKKGIDSLRISLQSIIATMNCLIGLVQLKMLLSQLRASQDNPANEAVRAVLQQQIAMRKDEVKSLRRRCKEAEKELRGLKSQLSQANTQNVDLCKMIVELTAQSARSELREAREVLSDIESASSLSSSSNRTSSESVPAIEVIPVTERGRDIALSMPQSPVPLLSRSRSITPENSPQQSVLSGRSRSRSSAIEVLSHLDISASGQTWMPTALVGPPVLSSRPASPHLPETNHDSGSPSPSDHPVEVLQDDLEPEEQTCYVDNNEDAPYEEFRRPRKLRQPDQGSHGH